MSQTQTLLLRSLGHAGIGVKITHNLCANINLNIPQGEDMKEIWHTWMDDHSNWMKDQTLHEYKRQLASQCSSASGGGAAGSLCHDKYRWTFLKKQNPAWILGK